MSRGTNNLRNILSSSLTKDELSKLKTAFDVVGDIAILEIDDTLKKKEKIIADTLLNLHKNVKVVCKKVGIHEGEFRLQNVKILAGEKRKETEYRENNCRFVLDIEKVYFSPRLSTERKRISECIVDKESVLVMFSGVAPYPLVISKNSPAKEIYAIEKNPEAHKYAEKNLLLNKSSNIQLFKGDVRNVLARITRKFDRVIMPLPRDGEDFLGLSLSCVKKRGVIHFYDFLHADDFSESRKKVMRECRKSRKRFRTLNFRKCGQSAPHFYRTCLDFRVFW